MTTLEANRDYIAATRHELDLDDDELATRIADYVVGELERLGSSNARLVMPVDEQGDIPGPCCSWCWSLGGLCPHIMGNGTETR
ncbi:hypothetical protein FHS23_004608 [Prauserella isguenensis]|uniref:Uncharacterized protein n=1 Tax=Prauserella isguenensis TaxID=1470180 RepID=A0A839S860_9PSEU|nr:hypothetical protein [Prauserella isguenensis]MBB3053554.1 hypothetical protein [Prauserella isguenensis]